MTKAFSMAMYLSITVHVPCPDDPKKQGIVHDRGVGSSPRGLKEQQFLELSLTLSGNTEEIIEKIPEFICTVEPTKDRLDAH